MPYLIHTRTEPDDWVAGWPASDHDEPDADVAAVKLASGRYIEGEAPPPPAPDAPAPEPEPYVQPEREPFWWLDEPERSQQIAALKHAQAKAAQPKPEPKPKRKPAAKRSNAKVQTPDPAEPAPDVEPEPVDTEGDAEPATAQEV